MRRLILITSIILLNVSCSTYKYPYTADAYYIDYSYLTSKGLFVTESNSVSFDYEPIGSIMVEVRSGYIPEVEKAKPLDPNKRRPASRRNIQPSNKIVMKTYVAATIDDALDYLYEESTSKGADGIIGLRINTLYPLSNESKVVIVGDGISISGMAVKRK